jgi:hypothetical protein
VLGKQLLSHPCIRQTAAAGYIMQLMKGSHLLLVTVYCSTLPWHICRLFMSLLCTPNHWLVYIFPLPYILQYSVSYLLAIGTSLLFQSEMEQYLKWCCNLLLQNYRSDWGWPRYQGPYVVMWPMSNCFISWLLTKTPPHQFIKISHTSHFQCVCMWNGNTDKLIIHRMMKVHYVICVFII